MKRRTLLLCALVLSVSAMSPVSAQTLPNPLMTTLMSVLGVTKDQAEGGLGAILTLAQEKLVKGDYDKIAAVIPGASKYLEKAKALGAVVGPLSNLAGLNGALGKLGINPATAAKFIPQVTNYVGKVGGKETGALLASALR